LRPSLARRACARFIRGARLALPQRCELCVASAGGALLCARCSASLPRLPAACEVCALPCPGGAICGACLAHPPPYMAVVAALVYAFPADRLLQQLKYGGRLALADWAAATLAASVEAALARRTLNARPDRVVALPLAVARQRERGFNQAREIASRIAAVTALPLAMPLARIGSGPPQAALSWSQRARNVRGAFAVTGEVRGASIALVDDVMTTGATLAEAARTLRRAGAARVECWVVARTLRPGQG
jgi:ComF family protein